MVLPNGGGHASATAAVTHVRIHGCGDMLWAAVTRVRAYWAWDPCKAVCQLAGMPAPPCTHACANVWLTVLGPRHGIASNRYAHYRASQEVAYAAAVSPAAAYLLRTYRWWRYTFPEYVVPASLPDPPGEPSASRQRAPTIVPFEHVRRKLGVWDKQIDNTLLFGHALPTEHEVAYRRAYLRWCA
jgi:hypothetical protein